MKRHSRREDAISALRRGRHHSRIDAIGRIAKRHVDAGPLEPLVALSTLLGDELAVHEVAHTRCGKLWATLKAGDGYLGETRSALQSGLQRARIDDRATWRRLV